MRSLALPLLALLACGWTKCQRPPEADIDSLRALAPTAARCGETDRVWNEGPIERATDAGYVYGASCDVIGGLSHPAVQALRDWCGALAEFREKCRQAGFKTGGAK